MNLLRTYLPILLAITCWSLSFVWIKDAYVDFSPLSLVVSRLVGASLLLVIIGLLTRKLQHIKRGDLKLFLGLAFFEPFLYFLGESFGMLSVSSTLGAVIISTIPLFTPFASYFIIKEKVSIFNILGILISLAGVLVIVLKGNGGLAAPAIGIILMFVAVFAAVIYPIFLKSLAHRYTGVTIVAYQNIIGFMYFLPLFIHYDLNTFLSTNFSSKSILATLELTIFASTLAFLFFTASIKKIGVMRTNVFANLIPALTAIFAFILRGDNLSLKKIIGIVIVISGLFICQLKMKQNHEN